MHRDAGDMETVASGGARLVATHDGRFWVFEWGLILPADVEATPWLVTTGWREARLR